MALIDKEAVRNFLINIPSEINKELTCTTDVLSGCAFRNNEILSFIDEQPVIESERRGWLIPTRKYGKKISLAKCSECGMTYYTEDSQLNYCQVCGVKFDKDVFVND